MLTYKITLAPTTGNSLGPFALFSDVDDYAIPFEVDISKADLEAGYISTKVPDGTLAIKCSSIGVCDNFDIELISINVDVYGVATLTGTLTSMFYLEGEVNGVAEVVPDLMKFNLFFGGIGADPTPYPTKNDLALTIRTPGYRDAQWNANMKAYDINHYHGADYTYLDEIQVWAKNQCGALYVWANLASNLTHFIDVEGKIEWIYQGGLRANPNLKSLYVPGCKVISGGGGYALLTGLRKLEGYLAFPELTQYVSGIKEVDEQRAVAYGPYYKNLLNHVLNYAEKVTTLYMPKVIRLVNQPTSISRHSFYAMTALKRVYMPLCKLTQQNDLINEWSYRMFNGGSCIGAIFYVHPDMATIRRADAILEFWTPSIGETVTINGLIYTAVSEVVNPGDFVITAWQNQYNGRSLMDAINADTRTGTVGDIRAISWVTGYGRVGTTIESTLLDSAGNAVTVSSSNPSTFKWLSTNLVHGGEEDRGLAFWISQGAEIRYVTNFDTPNAITDLSVSDITAKTCRLNFTVPTAKVNAIDFYEVWYYDGTDLMHLFVPRQEITGSGEVILDLRADTIHTIKIQVRDYLYNGSEFSNEVTFRTLEPQPIPLRETSLLGDSDLWVHYEFDGNALDSSGNDHHGTEKNIVNYSTDNPFAKGILLNSSGYIALPYSSNYIGTQTITMVARGRNRLFQNGSDWVNPSYRGWNNQMEIYNASTAGGYVVVRTGLGGQGGRNIYANPDENYEEEWHTYTAVVDFDTNKYDFYVDAVLKRSIVIDPGDVYNNLRGNGQDSTVGTRLGSNGANWGPFIGQILDFAYFKRALTVAEIEELCGK